VQAQNKHSQFDTAPRLSNHSIAIRFKGIIGETAIIYLSEDKDKLAVKVVIDKKVDNFCTNLEKSKLEDRLSELESEIRNLESSILKNDSLVGNCSKKGAQVNGLGRIRTGDLRRVKTEDSAFEQAFSCLSGLLFEVDETITRNASAPL